jgi:hypothetical protein
VSAQLKEAGFQMSGCGSYLFSFNNPTGQLKNYLPNYSGSGFGLDITYKKFVLSLGYYSSSLSKLKTNFDYNGSWLKDIPTKLYYPEVLIGYSIINKNIFSITPLIGASQPKITASDGYILQNGQFKDMSIYNSISPEIGLSFDFSYAPSSLFNYKDKKNYNYYLHLRLRFVYGFCYFNTTSSDLKGNFYSIQIGFGILAKKLKKKKK